MPHETITKTALFFTVTEEQKNDLLDWKFSYYDNDEDKYLNNFEESKFLSHLLRLFGPCNKYIYHIKELLDENGDDKITPAEWKHLFHTTGQLCSHRELHSVSIDR